MVKHLIPKTLAILMTALFICGCSKEKTTEQSVEAKPMPLPWTKAIWVTRWEYNSPETVKKVVENAKSIGLNTIYMQVRGEATTFYKSDIDPWALELNGGKLENLGKDPGWDPLDVAIKAAHANGLRLEAYVNIMPVWQRRTPPPVESGHVFAKHPEWLMVNKKGKRMDPAVDHFYACINPVREDVRQYLVSIVTELVTKYSDLDGIHYDYIRFPSDAGDYSYDEISLADYALHHHDMTPSRMPNVWRKWRCEKIEALLTEMHASIKAANPKANISAATFAGYWTAVNSMGQRWFEWPDKGLVDDVVPMLYDNNMERFEKRMNSFFSEKNRPKNGGRIVVGFWPNKSWKNYDLDMLKAQMKLIHDFPSGGYSIFSYNAVFQKHEPNDFAAYIKEYNDLYDSPAPQPPNDKPTEDHAVK